MTTALTADHLATPNERYATVPRPDAALLAIHNDLLDRIVRWARGKGICTELDTYLGLLYNPLTYTEDSGSVFRASDGLDCGGYDQFGYNANGYDSDGYDRDGFDSDDEDSQGQPRSSFNPMKLAEHILGTASPAVQQAMLQLLQNPNVATPAPAPDITADQLVAAYDEAKPYIVDLLVRYSRNTSEATLVAEGLRILYPADNRFADSEGFSFDSRDAEGYDLRGLDRNGLDRDGFSVDDRDARGFGRDRYDDPTFVEERVTEVLRRYRTPQIRQALLQRLLAEQDAAASTAGTTAE